MTGPERTSRHRIDSGLHGAKGGFRLKWPPSRVFLGEIIRTIDGPLCRGLAACAGLANSQRYQDVPSARWARASASRLAGC
jgi:DNA-binding IscR family transcriptional regulator